MYWAYHTLGVKPGASRELVRKSYLRLLKAYHPDMLRQRCVSQAVLKQELAKFYEVQRAWESLEGLFASSGFNASGS